MKKFPGAFLAVLTILACCTVTDLRAETSFAKKKKAISADDTFLVTGSEGETVICAKVGKKYRSGKIKGTKFLPAVKKLKAMQQQLAQSPEASSAKLEKKIKKFKKKTKASDLACATGGSSSPGSTSMEPLSDSLTREDVRYFLEKAGFGLSPKDENLVAVGTGQGVGALVDAFMDQKAENPALLSRIEDRLDGALGSTTTQTPAGQRGALIDLWTHTKNPYSEKLALFLLSVWTVSGDVISDETFRYAFWDYYTRLRQATAGETNLPDLGVAITRDPLMLIYLNNELNVKGKPNENFARELMELFTLGPTNLQGNPNYTETALDGSGDIAVAAKMLTGWTVTRDYTPVQLVVEYHSDLHEPGTHTMFAGQPYQFSGQNDEDLVRGIFAHHPGVKNYYAKEILKYYLTPNPSAELIKNFGQVIESRGYNLRAAMKVLFKSQAFFSAAYRNTVPKDSAEFLVEVIRLLELEDNFNVFEAQHLLGNMGMQVNYVPSVFWYNPNAWISPSVQLERANFVAYVIGDHTYQEQTDPDWVTANILPAGAATPRQVIEKAALRLGIGALSESQISSLVGYMNTRREYDNTLTPEAYDNTDIDLQKRKGAGVYYALIGLPVFQLK